MLSLSALESAIGYAFKDKSLLEQALTHRSYSAHHNERLEFLGDSVLGCVVTSMLYHKFIKHDEGDLSRVRASLVKQSALAEIALRLNLPEFIRLGEGELKSGGFRRPSILADALEAILGAIYLDGGFEAAQKVIDGLYANAMDHIDAKSAGKDPKTLLQEFLQAYKLALPEYEVLSTAGAPHDQAFEVACTVAQLGKRVVASGNSRRIAEQAAAQKILEDLYREQPFLGSRLSGKKSAKSAGKAIKALAASQEQSPK